MAINDINRTMGPSASQSHTSDAIGHAEDLSPIITNIDPDLSFFLSEFDTGEAAESLKFEWPLDRLKPPGVNAQFEKHDYTSGPVGSLEYKENQEQFFETSGEVTHAQRKVRKAYNPQDEFERLFQQSMIQHARDIEYAIVNNAISRGESKGTLAAMTGGIPFFMESDTLAVTVSTSDGKITSTQPHNLETGDFVYLNGATIPGGLDAKKTYYVRLDEGAPATAFTLYDTMQGAVEDIASKKVVPTTAGTDVTILRNNVVDLGGVSDYTLDDIDDAMQMAYNRGGNPTLCVMSPAKKKRFSQQVTNMTQINRNMGKSRKIDLVAESVETDFGTINVKTHRMMGDDKIYLLDMQYWKHRWFEHTHRVPNLPNVGTYDRYVISSTYGLQGSQPKASACITGIKR